MGQVRDFDSGRVAGGVRGVGLSLAFATVENLEIVAGVGGEQAGD